MATNEKAAAKEKAAPPKPEPAKAKPQVTPR